MNSKGMSVTIAAVILVGVTVAITIAVAAWVGALIFQWMETEELVLTEVACQGTSGALDNHIVVSIQNSGAEDVTLLKARVTGHNVDKIIDFLDITVGGGEKDNLNLSDVGWHSGYTYQVELLTSRGNKFSAIGSA